MRNKRSIHAVGAAAALFMAMAGQPFSEVKESAPSRTPHKQRGKAFKANYGPGTVFKKRKKKK
jgi:hypothetical protein